ncbi:MAG: hypothetical protein V1782_09875 [Pseudomonadota bacterium]
MNEYKEIIIAIITIIGGGFITWFIYQKTRKHTAIQEFKDFFLSERYKITTDRNIQDVGLQENAIRKLDGTINASDISAINDLWKDYKKAEEQCRQVISPGNGSLYIHYGEHKPKILSKIDKIINYLK